jgi:hypothetical protein
MHLFLKNITATHGSVEQCAVNPKLLSAESVGRIKSNMIVPATQWTYTSVNLYR